MLLIFLRPRGPLTWLDPGAFGTLAVGGGFALGAKLCRPESEGWVIYGDGSLGYSVAEFDTFTRHKVNFTGSEFNFFYTGTNWRLDKNFQSPDDKFWSPLFLPLLKIQ